MNTSMVATPAPTGTLLVSELALLADPTRLRILAVLDGVELTVAELHEVIALPQSTISRHLRPLTDAGWLVARRDGVRRYYTVASSSLAEQSRQLWELLRERVAALDSASADRTRLQTVLERRRLGSDTFFATAAEEWDALRAHLYGATSDLRILPALVSPHADLVDLGCGSGRLAAILAPYARSVTGVDASASMLDQARGRLRDSANVHLVCAPLEALPLDDASVDQAFCVHVLHHLADPGRVLGEAARVLRPGGRLIVLDLAPHDREHFRRRLGHVWLGFSRAYITDSCAKAGLRLERYHPLSPDPGAHSPGLFVATAIRAAVTADGVAADQSPRSNRR